MALLRLRSVAALIAATGTICVFGWADAQGQSGLPRSGDGPNKKTPTDVAAAQVVDSLFTPNAKPQPPKFKTPRKKIAQARRPAPSRVPLQGKLVRNPDTTDGSPKFALVDRYGGVLRYVEPVDMFDLELHIGENVTVRHDSGDILLASQLEFPDPASAATPAPDVQYDTNVRLTNFEEELAEPGETGEESIVTPTPDERSYTEGPVYSEGQPYMDGGTEHCGCPQCGSMMCNQQGGCGRNARGIVYLRAEYLLWDFDGFFIPPLVVEGDADEDPQDPNGPPAFADAVVVYGNERILDGTRDGIRILAGIWLDDCGHCGIEGDWLHFDAETEVFIDGGDGVTPPFVGRPFIDATTGLDAVEDVSFPGIMGDVIVESSSEFETAGLRFRHNICCAGGGGCGCGDAVDCGCGVGVGCGSGVCGKRSHFVDFLFGFRYANLEESLIITENLETVEASPSIPTTEIFLQDRFFTENRFYGGELGFVWELLQDRWSLELLSKVAIGNNRQEVHIHGITTTTFQGQSLTKIDSGLLVQPTNAGDYERDEFVVIPEVGATVGYQLTPRFRLTAGYTLIYWGNVVRPGDQIDLEVNPTYLTNPLPNPLLPPFRPAFAFNETDFWAHGLSLGGEMRW